MFIRGSSSSVITVLKSNSTIQSSGLLPRLSEPFGLQGLLAMCFRLQGFTLVAALRIQESQDYLELR